MHEVYGIETKQPGKQKKALGRGR